MNNQLTRSLHSFHIPVMGTGFTIDTPLKVAHYGISAVVSLVDDVLIEQMRKLHCSRENKPFEAITKQSEDFRARRITAYLNMMDDIVRQHMDNVRNSLFETGSEITRYYEMLPDSQLKKLYKRMLATQDPGEKSVLQKTLRDNLQPGNIDVNIMTKLDRDKFEGGIKLAPEFADAMSALRGFAESRLNSSVVLSAGLNQRLFCYISRFEDFFPDNTGEIKKRIILKVSDFRSALIQGKILAKKGLWVSEYRVESGLNCGGHAFGGKGQLMGPILTEFKEKREKLSENLLEFYNRGLESLGRTPVDRPSEIRVTVQGGIGTAEENAMLMDHYQVDGTGWATPFLMVPEVVNIDPGHLQRLSEAGDDDVYLSKSSPLGIPFWSLRTSDSEVHRQEMIAKGKPGSGCPKGYLAFNTEFTDLPICTASRKYQTLKLQEMGSTIEETREKDGNFEGIFAKACICHDLAGSATNSLGISKNASGAICSGPNIVNFSKVAKLREMVDHIYGRASLPLVDSRPHMFIRELALSVDQFKKEIGKQKEELIAGKTRSLDEYKTNLADGIQHYRSLASTLLGQKQDQFLSRLSAFGEELDRLLPGDEKNEAAE